jgi:predicted GNAT family N-acyltransferase
MGGILLALCGSSVEEEAMAKFPITLICDATSSDARARVRDGVSAAGNPRILGTDDSLSLVLDFVSGSSRLLETVSSLVHEPGSRRLIAISDSLAVAGEMRPQPSEITKHIRSLVLPTNHLCGLVALLPGARRRISDIDRVLDATELTSEAVGEAVAKTASGLWLKSPPAVRTTIDQGSAIKVHLARSQAELRACLALRYQVYEMMGYLEDEVSASASKLELDWFDLNALHFAAVDHATGRMAGTARLVLPNIAPFLVDSVVGRAVQTREAQAGWCRAIAAEAVDTIFRRKLTRGFLLSLPILQSTDFRDRWPDVLHEADEGGELSRVIVAPRYRGGGISRLLVRAAIATAFDLRKRYLMLECVPAHEAMYAKYGFTPLEGYHTRTAELDQVALGMTLKLSDRADNSAVALAKRDLEMIRRGTIGAGALGDGAHLCLCENTFCWNSGGYDFRARQSCPLHAVHRP